MLPVIVRVFRLDSCYRWGAGGVGWGGVGWGGVGWVGWVGAGAGAGAGVSVGVGVGVGVGSTYTAPHHPQRCTETHRDAQTRTHTHDGVSPHHTQALVLLLIVGLV